MAASATTLSSSFSSLSIHSSHPSTFYNQSSSFITKSLFYKPTSPISFSSSLSLFPSKSHKPKPIKARWNDYDSEDEYEPEYKGETKPEIKNIYLHEFREEDLNYEPPPRPEGYVRSPSFDELPPETEEEITAAYEKLYGPAYSGVSVLGNDINIMDSKRKKPSEFLSRKEKKVRDNFEERVVQVRRVTKVVKGGKQMNFRAVVVVGDKQGNVGVGVGKAKEVIAAVQKSATNARRNVITVPLTKYSTFPHRADGKFGAAKVMLRPASPGSGVIAGGAVRIVLEMAGVENALGKQIGSKNALNNARATVVAVQQMRQFKEVAEFRGIPMEELWK